MLNSKPFLVYMNGRYGACLYMIFFLDCSIKNSKKSALRSPAIERILHKCNLQDSFSCLYTICQINKIFIIYIRDFCNFESYLSLLLKDLKIWILTQTMTFS